MVYGASTMGIRAMTSSSGPGISLKAEGISYLASCKLPALIVNVSRGAGSGLDSAGTVRLSAGYQGSRPWRLQSNGLCSYSLQEAVDLTYEAFEYAERDRNPVFLLMDGCLGAIMELVELPEMKEPTDENTKKWNLSKKEGEKRPPRALTPIYPEVILEMENKLRGELYKKWEKEDVKVEEFMTEDAEYIVVAYGIAARVAKEAVLTLREQGCKIGMIRPITLYPFPKQSFHKLDYDKVKAIIDIELTIPAQMRDDIALEVMNRAPIFEYGRSGGNLLDDDGVYDAIMKVIKEVG